jgi:hypothetical protein
MKEPTLPKRTKKRFQRTGDPTQYDYYCKIRDMIKEANRTRNEPSNP